MNDSHLLKQLTTQLSKIESEISALKTDLKIKNKELDSKKKLDNLKPWSMNDLAKNQFNLIL